ncbi:FAD-binding domain-containing protein [Trametopsis cervina]|nr:FAD-binding domain-containing protein [Trametopsis cervina]
MLSFLALAFAALPAFTGVAAVPASNSSVNPLAARLQTCSTIASSISPASGVFFSNTTEYNTNLIYNYVTTIQDPACSVEPATPKDVATILTILGKTRDAFAIKGGGHAFNQNFSSTEGILIALKRLNNISYDKKSNTVEVGSGLVWDDVYRFLGPLGVNVVGGRISGVGVPGFLLGGGYSCLTNAHGLGSDNIVAYELVLPSGKIIDVTQKSNPDLFWGLQGGYNNFGIVTKFTLKAYPQGKIWGGTIVHDIKYSDHLIDAAVNFSKTVNDPKSELFFSFLFSNGTTQIASKLFYNAPTPPPGMFDTFLATPTIFRDIQTRDFITFIQNLSTDARGEHSTVPTMEYTAPVLKAFLNETTFWAEKAYKLDPNVWFQYAAEPFISSILQHAQPGGSAYPASRSFAFRPTSIEWSWTDPSLDAVMNAGMSASTQAFTNKLIALGQKQVAQATPYGNYASNFHFSSQDIFGASMPRLSKIKATYDPQNVMGQTGGWKVTTSSH